MTDVDAEPTRPVLESFSLSRLRLRNRAVVSPMTRVSATPRGVPTARMATYYGAFAQGGFGLVITEGIYTDEAFSQAYAKQPGLVTTEQVDGWRRVTDAVHETDASIFAQLMHAGALSQTLEKTAGPSTVPPKGEKMPEYGGAGAFPAPKAMTGSDLTATLDGFARSAANAVTAGFDGVEIHGANGYLIDQFLTDYTNHRDDHYGGSVEDRARFAVDVVSAVRAALPRRVPVGIRLSQGKVNDHHYRWPGGESDAKAIFTAVADARVDYVHVASEGASWDESARIADGVTTTQLARRVTGLPVIANGGMRAPDQADAILRDGHGDLVSLARGALANPDWPCRVRDGRDIDAFDPAMLDPMASIDNADTWRAAQHG